jgi:alpha-galactosidase
VRSWLELLSAQLGVRSLGVAADQVPFGIPPVPDSAWRIGSLDEIDTGWRLTAATAGGLEATYRVRAFADTRVVECDGEIVNRGSTAVRGISRSLVLDATLPLPPEYTRAWLRSVNGVRFVPTYFPPYDFAVQDRQIRDIRLVGSNITLSSAENGRTSVDDLPVAILGDEAGRGGLAFMLEWSGLWSMTFRRPSPGAEPPRSALTVEIGIWGLDLDLEPGETLPLPRLAIAAYDGDLDAGGNAVRRHIRRHVTPPLDGREVLPPTSFNHWFAFGNDFTADLLTRAVDASAEVGLEYFVVDSGWFRGGHGAGVGNWDSVDETKFPRGVAPFADYVRSKGLKYGTWFEPEWAHRESDLYRNHPEWFWDTPPESLTWSPSSNGFFQSVEYSHMNFGLAEVRAWWLERIVRAYEEWGVRWIRWDNNHHPRPNWEHGVPSGRVGWRQIQHVQGLYRVLDEILAACPDLFLEQCASGGHRIDLGMARRGHSFWMNDVTEETDLVRAFQHGLNTVFPGNYANTNLSQPRHDFSEYDYLSHATGGFGYSGRIWEAPEEDLRSLKAAVAQFKRFRHLLLGDYARPTGQPRRPDEYARVVFSEGEESVTIQYNHPTPGSARIDMAPPRQQSHPIAQQFETKEFS